MSNDNIKVVVCHSWDVIVIGCEDTPDMKIINDESFPNCRQALMYAALQADKYGVRIIHQRDHDSEG